MADFYNKKVKTEKPKLRDVFFDAMPSLLLTPIPFRQKNVAYRVRALTRGQSRHDLAGMHSECREIFTSRHSAFFAAADDLLKVRKERALLQTTLEEMRAKYKRDVEALKENMRKARSEMDAARKLHETEMCVMKDACDRREGELKQIRAEAVKASQVREGGREARDKREGGRRRRLSPSMGTGE